MNFILIVSLALGAIGMCGYMFECSAGRIERYSTWGELTRRQWVFVALLAQGTIILAIAFFGRLL